MSNKYKKILSGATMLLMVLSSLPLGMTNIASAALVPGGAVGPVIPAGIGKGFPAWYMDQNGLALEVMEAADGFGISDPVNPANNFSQELGFNAEGFYWFTEGAPVNPNGNGVSLMVLALEMAFAGEAAVDGEQSVFGRIRFRFDVGEPGTYTIRHPFGTNIYVIDTVLPGAPEINDSSDIGCFATLGVLSCDPNNPPGNPNNFGLALQSGIGPFLTWDTFNLNPALTDPLLVNVQNPTKRYVGNPNVDHAITGSPVGQNFIRVEGPNIGGPGINFIEETQFAVGGRIAVIDTVAPVINVTPISAPLGATNVVVSTNITDNIGVRSANIDLGPLGNTLTASINNSQEVPPTGSTATGSGTFTIDTAANTLSFNINATGLTGLPITHVHIHQGAAGTNGPMLFDMGNALPAIGVWNYPEASEAGILAGNTYIQIHTALFDNPLNLAFGEIRGQILPQTNIVPMTLVTLPNTNGIWSVLIPSVDRLGTFNLPITATDGSQIANATLVLTVNQLTSVNVAPAAASIVIGGTQQLTASPLDNTGAAFNGATVTWSSSNNGVATVSATGLVTGVAAGSATITATAVGGGVTVTGTSAITVTSVAPVLTSISVTPASATVNVAGTAQLTASALDQFGVAMVPQPAITWASANTGIASVNGTGLVTGVALGGPVVITASSGLISGSSNITVSATPVCQTGADTSADGLISNLEILSYIQSWKAGSVSNLLILQAIGFWKAGVGC